MPEEIKCPFCAEKIQADAKKCKHCGEWLDRSYNPSGSQADAKSIAKGLKEKEWQTSTRTMGCLGAIILGVVLGIIFKNFFIGIVITFIVAFLVEKSYWKK